MLCDVDVNKNMGTLVKVKFLVANIEEEQVVPCASPCQLKTGSIKISKLTPSPSSLRKRGWRGGLLILLLLHPSKEVVQLTDLLEEES